MRWRDVSADAKCPWRGRERTQTELRAAVGSYQRATFRMRLGWANRRRSDGQEDVLRHLAVRCLSGWGVFNKTVAGFIGRSLHLTEDQQRTDLNVTFAHRLPNGLHLVGGASDEIRGCHAHAGEREC